MGKSGSKRSGNGSEVSSKTERRRNDDDATGEGRDRGDSVATGSSRRKSSKRDNDDYYDRSNPSNSNYATASRSSQPNSAENVADPSFAAAYTQEPGETYNRPQDSFRSESVTDVAKDKRRDSKRSSKSSRRRTIDDEFDDNDDSRINNRGDGAQSDRPERRKSSRSEKESSSTFDAHEAALPPNQFPGEFPSTYAAPYRPPGLAADYYGDQGESVAFQPGVRPVAPSIITTADQAHLHEPTTEAKPPPEPSSLGQVGAAASFYALDDEINETPDTTPSKLGRKSTLMADDTRDQTGTSRAGPLPDGRMQHSTDNISIGPMSSAGVTAGVGAAAEYYSSSNLVGNNAESATISDYNVSNAPGRVDNNQSSAASTQNVQPSNSAMYGAAAAAGLAGAAIGAHYSHDHSGSQNQSYPASNPDSNFVIGQNQSAFPQMQQKQRRRNRGPVGKFVDWFRDPQGVADFEAYTEAIGVCKYCFDPMSSPADAPRKHHYHRRRTSSGSRHGSSTRVDKIYRYSSDEDRKRRSNTKKAVAAGLAGYGATKIGEAVFKQKNDFDDTYSVKSGRPNNNTRVSFKETEDDKYSSRKHRKYSTTEDVKIERKNSERISDRKSYKSDRKSSGRRDSSSSTSSRGISHSTAMGIGAGVAGAALMASSSGDKRRRNRSRSPSKKGYYSKRISPRHSYVDLNDTNTGAMGFGSFFSSPSANNRKGKNGKGLFSFSNASSSSSDADLAFGQGTVRRKTTGRGRKNERKSKHGEDLSSAAAIAGLAATGAALAAESDRRQGKGKGKRDANSSIGRNDRRQNSSRIALEDHETTTDVENDGAWIDASDDEKSNSSIDTGLAYGGRNPNRQSRESMAAKESTPGWGWDWNSKDKVKQTEENKRRRVTDSDARRTGSKIDGMTAGVIGAGVGIAAANMMTRKDSNQLPPMQQLDPVPTSDSTYVNGRNVSQISGISPFSSIATATAGPDSIPLQQPQPVTPISTSLYNVQPKIGEDSYSRKVESRDETRRRRRDSSPAKLPSHDIDNNASFGFETESIGDEQRAKEKEERRRLRREAKERKQSVDETTIEKKTQSTNEEAADTGSRERTRKTSVDVRAAREAEIERELERLYEEDRIMREERKRKDEDRRRKVESVGVAAAAAAVGAGIVAATVADKEKRDGQSEDESKPRRKSSLKKSKDREASPQNELQQERIARMAAKIVRSKASPVHEDYSTFFLPEELAGNVKEHNEKAEHRDDVGAAVVEIIPGGKREGKFDPFNYRPFGFRSDDDPGKHPWPVPMLDLIEPTPPHSRVHSERGDASPAMSAKETDLSDIDDNLDKKSASGSRVTWGDHDTYVYEVQTPEYERSDFMIDSQKATGSGPELQSSPAKVRETKPHMQDPPVRSKLSQVETIEEDADSTPTIPPVEEMTKEQQEHLALGKDFKDLPTSEPPHSIINPTEESRHEPVEHQESTSVFDSSSNSKSFYQSPFAETVSDLGRIDEPGSTIIANEPKRGSGFVKAGEARELSKQDELVGNDRPHSDRSIDRSERGHAEGDSSFETKQPIASEAEVKRDERQILKPDDEVVDSTNVFDYLVDAKGENMPTASVLGAAATSVLSSATSDDEKSRKRRNRSSEVYLPQNEAESVEFSKPSRSSTFDESINQTTPSKNDYTSDPEDWERSTFAKKKDTKDTEEGYDKQKSRRRKSKRDSDVLEGDDTKSTSSQPNSGESKSSRRKSKRDSEIFDDGDDARSVSSAPADGRKKSKDKKSSSGIFSGIFSSSKSDVSSSSKKSSKSSKSDKGTDTNQIEDGERRRTRKSKDKDSDEIRSSVSEPIRQGSLDSLPASEKPVSKFDFPEQNIEDGFVSADEDVLAKGDVISNDQQSFLAKSPEMPKSTVMDIPTDFDGVLGLKSEREPSIQVHAAPNEEHHGWGDSEAQLFNTENEISDSRPELTPTSRRLSAIQTTGFPGSPGVVSSPTAVPLHFRRLPVSPAGGRASFSSPIASPSSPLTTPRTRQTRPKSTEFRSSKEFRPLYLVEKQNFAKAVSPEPDEIYPSLPSSRTSSAHPSIEDLRAEANLNESHDYFSFDRIDPSTFNEVKRRHSYSYWHDDPKRSRSPDYLDSRSATPVPGDTQRELTQEKRKPKYEFHSPSELLQDPALHEDVADENYDFQPTSPLPSIVSTDHEQDYMSARSRSASPKPVESRHRSSRARSESFPEADSRRNTIIATGLGILGGTSLGIAAHEVLKDSEDPTSAISSTTEGPDMYGGDNILSKAESTMPVIEEPVSEEGEKRTLEEKSNAIYPTEQPIAEGSSEHALQEKGDEKDDSELVFPTVTSKKSKKEKKEKKKKRKTLDLEDTTASTELEPTLQSQHIESREIENPMENDEQRKNVLEGPGGQQPALVPTLETSEIENRDEKLDQSAQDLVISERSQKETDGTEISPEVETDGSAEKPTTSNEALQEQTLPEPQVKASKSDKKKKKSKRKGTVTDLDLFADKAEETASFELPQQEPDEPLTAVTSQFPDSVRTPSSHEITKEMGDNVLSQTEQVTKDLHQRKLSISDQAPETGLLSLAGEVRSSGLDEQQMPAAGFIEDTDIVTSLSERASRSSFPWDDSEHMEFSKTSRAVHPLEQPSTIPEIVSFSVDPYEGPSIEEVNTPQNHLGAFEEAFERAVKARGLSQSSTREEALGTFLPERNNAPFVAKGDLTPIKEASKSSSGNDLSRAAESIGDVGTGHESSSTNVGESMTQIPKNFESIKSVEHDELLSSSGDRYLAQQDGTETVRDIGKADNAQASIEKDSAAPFEDAEIDWDRPSKKGKKKSKKSESAKAINEVDMNAEEPEAVVETPPALQDKTESEFREAPITKKGKKGKKSKKKSTLDWNEEPSTNEPASTDNAVALSTGISADEIFAEPEQIEKDAATGNLPVHQTEALDPVLDSTDNIATVDQSLPEDTTDAKEEPNSIPETSNKKRKKKSKAKSFNWDDFPEEAEVNQDSQAFDNETPVLDANTKVLDHPAEIQSTRDDAQRSVLVEDYASKVSVNAGLTDPKIAESIDHGECPAVETLIPEQVLQEEGNKSIEPSVIQHDPLEQALTGTGQDLESREAGLDVENLEVAEPSIQRMDDVPSLDVNDESTSQTPVEQFEDLTPVPSKKSSKQAKKKAKKDKKGTFRELLDDGDKEKTTEPSDSKQPVPLSEEAGKMVDNLRRSDEEVWGDERHDLVPLESLPSHHKQISEQLEPLHISTKEGTFDELHEERPFDAKGTSEDPPVIDPPIKATADKSILTPDWVQEPISDKGGEISMTPAADRVDPIQAQSYIGPRGYDVASAKELHEEPAHQDWLAGATAMVSTFPSKPSSRDLQYPKIQETSEIFEEPVPSISEPVDGTDKLQEESVQVFDPTQDVEENFTKSKKKAKKNKRKSLQAWSLADDVDPVSENAMVAPLAVETASQDQEGAGLMPKDNVISPSMDMNPMKTERTASPVAFEETDSGNRDMIQSTSIANEFVPGSGEELPAETDNFEWSTGKRSKKDKRKSKKQDSVTLDQFENTTLAEEPMEPDVTKEPLETLVTEEKGDFGVPVSSKESKKAKKKKKQSLLFTGEDESISPSRLSEIPDLQPATEFTAYERPDSGYQLDTQSENREITTEKPTQSTSPFSASLQPYDDLEPVSSSFAEHSQLSKSQREEDPTNVSVLVESREDQLHGDKGVAAVSSQQPEADISPEDRNDNGPSDLHSVQQSIVPDRDYELPGQVQHRTLDREMHGSPDQQETYQIPQASTEMRYETDDASRTYNQPVEERRIDLDDLLFDAKKKHDERAIDVQADPSAGDTRVSTELDSRVNDLVAAAEREKVPWDSPKTRNDAFLIEDDSTLPIAQDDAESVMTSKKKKKKKRQSALDDDPTYSQRFETPAEDLAEPNLSYAEELIDEPMKDVSMPDLIAPVLVEQTAKDDDFDRPKVSRKQSKKDKKKSRLSTFEGTENSGPSYEDVPYADVSSRSPVPFEHQKANESGMNDRPEEKSANEALISNPVAEEDYQTYGKKKSKKEKKKKKTLLQFDDDAETPTSGDVTPAQDPESLYGHDDANWNNDTPGPAKKVAEHESTPHDHDHIQEMQEQNRDAPNPVLETFIEAAEPKSREADMADIGRMPGGFEDPQASEELEPVESERSIFVPQESEFVSEDPVIDPIDMPTADSEYGTVTRKKSKKDKKRKKASVTQSGDRDDEVTKSSVEPAIGKQRAEVESDEIINDYHRDRPAESDGGSDVSITTRERRRRRKSPPTWTGEEPADLPRNRAVTPRSHHDDIMDTALGVAAGLGLGSTEATNTKENKPSTNDETSAEWSFKNLKSAPSHSKNEANRDSGVQFVDSPSLANQRFPAMRDSGFVPSPHVRHSWEGEQPKTEESLDTNLRAPRPVSPTSSTEDVRSTLRKVPSSQTHGAEFVPESHLEPKGKAHNREYLDTPVKRHPSPVDSTSKDRSSGLFNSSPAAITPKIQHLDTSNVHPSTDIHRSPSIHGHHRSREQLRALDQASHEPEQSDRLASNLIDRAATSEVNRSAFSPSPRHSTDRPFSPTKSSLNTIPEYSMDHGVSRELHKDFAKGSESNQDSRHSRHQDKTAMVLGAAAAATTVAVASRDDPATSNKALGRPKSRTSSQRSLRNSQTSPYHPSNFASGSSTSLADVNDIDQSASLQRDMADVYDGVGSMPGSPRSPTRPPSIRRRQSIQQIRDLEARVDQLANENRSLAEAKLLAERHLEELHLDQSRGDNSIEQNLPGVNAQLQERDEEIERLKAEVADLTATHEMLRGDHDKRYSVLEDEHTNKQSEWQESTKELESLRSQHAELSSGMEDIVRHEIDAALVEKNAQIERLYHDLELAKEKIRSLQAAILARGSDDVVVVRDEDYFDNACQQLCQHVQQWVLRFSKFSDTRLCRSTNEVRDEKIVDRFDNAILDGSDVDFYLADRVKRRDVFMSVVMTMIWEYVFTRYLFGMDREQRQKLKQLEKNLSEVGSISSVRQWRALTLTLLSKRDSFSEQRESDTEAVAIEIFMTLAKFLPPPKNLEQQIQESLQNVMRAAVELSIEMRIQRAEYTMLPPLQPEYDTNGDLARKVNFNASLMNERSGETSSNEELQQNGAVVRMVLFPLVVKKGDDGGNGDEEIVVCPAQVLVARTDKGKKVKGSGRVFSGSSQTDRMVSDNKSLGAVSTHSLGAMSGVEMAGSENMI